MAPRPRETPPAPGLLASAFSFVSRELESFVTAATGGDPTKSHTQPEASSSRVTLDRRRRQRDEVKEDSAREREKERRGKRERKRSEVESDRARAKRRLRQEVEGERATKVAKKITTNSRGEERERERERSSEREAADDEDDELPVRPKSLKKRRDAANARRDIAEAPEPETCSSTPARIVDDAAKLIPPPCTPITAPSPQRTNMTPFPTMPGSLFPRSESLIPETIPAKYRRAIPRPRTPSLPPLAQVTEDAEDSEPAHEAHAEPYVIDSPERGRSRDHSRGHDGRGAEDHASPSTARESSRRPSSSSRTSFDDGPESVGRLRSIKGKQRECDTSGEIRVRGKERELREAREDHARNARDQDVTERERDKQRIRMLEEEVARLRAELAMKSSPSILMPPPPPPPPPPLFRPQVPTNSDNNPNFLASARASLKPTAPPVEAPINSAAYGGARTRKTGQPTLNLSSDKMAAFLREMKSVRLRKVGGAAGSMGPPLFPPSAAGDVAGEPIRSNGVAGMSDARRAATLGDMSFDAGVAARIFIGEKRKRDVSDEPLAGPSKRRETTFLRSDITSESPRTASLLSSFASSSQASTSSSQSSASSSQSSQSSASGPSLFDVPQSRSRSSRSKANTQLRIWPTRSTETDVTTPSLCSDNENDHSEDKLPDTPSDSVRGPDEDAQAVKSTEVFPKEEPEIIDVDALETPPRPGQSSSIVTEARKNPFARRPPGSPLPSKSPSKPMPPARSRAKPLQVSKSSLPRRVPIAAPVPAGHSADSDDPSSAPLSRPQSRRSNVADYGSQPVAGPSRLPQALSISSARSRSNSRAQGDSERSESRMSNHARRRLTLDEELRRAGDSLWRESSEEAERPLSPPAEDLDSGNLVALGTKSSKRGFLAGGGGAGVPVFMGEGYVQGATEEDEGHLPRNASGSTTRKTIVVRRR